MFVTSDTIDLSRIGRFREFNWRENLLGGVEVLGTEWRGYQAGASFLIEAAKCCGVINEMEYAGYNRPGDRRTRSILPKSFERLTRGELAGAKSAVSVLLRGTRAVAGAEMGTILFGGDASGSERWMRGPTGALPVPNYPYRAFQADFVFPLSEHSVEAASELFQLSVDILGAEYGYFFVRDQACAPWLYAQGMGTGLDHGAFNRAESDEIGQWGLCVSEGGNWTGKRPVFRDLFQVNLISARHTSAPIEGLGYLHEWIAAQAGRGRLEEVRQGRLLWILSDAEMVQVRPVLNEAGLLFTCRERVYRDLPQGAADAQRMYAAQAGTHAGRASDALLDYPGRFRD